MKVTKTSYGVDPEIISRGDFEGINIMVSKTVVAGEVYPANDNTAEGVILYGAIGTESDKAPTVLLKKAYLRKSKLPVAITAEAKASLPMIVEEDIV